MLFKLINGYRYLDEAGGDGGEGGGGIPEGVTMQQLYNENKKYQRLLSKNQTDMSSMQERMTGYDDMQRQMSGLSALFGGQQEKPAEGAPPMSLLQRAMQANQSVIDANPESQGIPLTVDTARAAEEALSMVKKQQETIEALQKQNELMASPQHAAEQNSFASLESTLREAVLDLYGNQTSADENYEDFQRVAISRMTEMRNDPFLWGKFITRPEFREKFVHEVIRSKIPNAYVKKGSEAIDHYSVDSAMQDSLRADAIKNPVERAELRKKARQRMLLAQTDLHDMGNM